MLLATDLLFLKVLQILELEFDELLKATKESFNKTIRVCPGSVSTIMPVLSSSMKVGLVRLETAVSILLCLKVDE